MGTSATVAMRTVPSPSWRAKHATGPDPVRPPCTTTLISRRKVAAGPPMRPDLIRPRAGHDAEPRTVPIEALVPHRVLRGGFHYYRWLFILMVAGGGCSHIWRSGYG